MTLFQEILMYTYPDVDLLPVCHENAETTVAAHLTGDGLFEFLWNELGDDCCNYDEAVRRIDKAIEALQAVRDELAAP